MKKCLLLLLCSVAANAQIELNLNPLVVCEEDTDGIAAFDLHAGIESQLTDLNLEFYSVEFYSSPEAMEAGLALPSVYTNSVPFEQTIYVAVTEIAFPDNTGWAPVDLIVSGTPSIGNPSVLTMCDPDGDTQEMTDLTVIVPEVLNGLDPGGFTVTFHLSEEHAENVSPAITMPEAFLTTSQVVYIRVENAATGCYVVTSFDIIINAAPQINNPSPLVLCDDNYDGQATFDLTSKNAEITGGNPEYIVTYYENDSMQDPIAVPGAYTNTTTTIYATVETVDGCVASTELGLKVNPLPPAIDFPSVFSCSGVYDLTAHSSLVPGGYAASYHTSVDDATANENPIADPQSYNAPDAEAPVWIRIENASVAPGEPACYTVSQIGLEAPGEIVATIMTQGQTIIVNAAGYGMLLYSIDGGAFQESNVFEGVAYGTRTITIQDGCGNSSLLTIEMLPEVPAGDTDQMVLPGATLADLEVEGENIQWYDNPGDVPLPPGDGTDMPLPLTTVVQDGITYYASQTIDGVESSERLGVTVHIAMGTGEKAFAGLQYYPNPAKGTLTLSNPGVIDRVTVHNLAGQKVLEAPVHATEAKIDTGRLDSGVYLMSLTSGAALTTIKIIID